MKKIIALVAAFAAVCSTSNAGYVEYNQDSYSAKIYMNIDNRDASTAVDDGDIVRSVQFFSYTDTTINATTQYAVALSFMEVTNWDTVNKKYNFETVADTGAGGGSLSRFLSDNSISTTGLDSTGVAVDGLDFVLLTRSTAFSSTNFNWNSADFGLGSGWEVDVTAGLVSGATFQAQGAFNTFNPGFDTQYPVSDPTQGFTNGQSTSVNGSFDFTISAVRDTNDDLYTANTAIGSFATPSEYIIKYGAPVSGAPTGTQLYADLTTVTTPNLNSVPEPTSLAVLTGLLSVGVISRRRRK